MSVKLGGYGSNRENARLSKYSQRSCRLLPWASCRGLNIIASRCLSIPESEAAGGQVRFNMRKFLLFFLVLLAQKNIIAIFFYNFSCSSCAGEFGRHFVCGKSLQVAFFFKGKKFLTKKKLLSDFFPEVKKPCAEISSENENCGFPQKCGGMEALRRWPQKRENT